MVPQATTGKNTAKRRLCATWNRHAVDASQTDRQPDGPGPQMIGANAVIDSCTLVDPSPCSGKIVLN
jgi:hypothetical protein